jgi:hypothetical protein
VTRRAVCRTICYCQRRRGCPVGRNAPTRCRPFAFGAKGGRGSCDGRQLARGCAGVRRRRAECDPSDGSEEAPGGGARACVPSDYRAAEPSTSK